jgi:cystathionine beta-lyase family protein involved in aluminum resistance
MPLLWGYLPVCAGRLLVYLGAPYDTLDMVIGNKKPVPGSIVDCGHLYRELSLILTICPPLTAALVPRKPEFSHPALTRLSMAWLALRYFHCVAIIKAIKKGCTGIVFEDNCYGEFVESIEPSA